MKNAEEKESKEEKEALLMKPEPAGREISHRWKEYIEFRKDLKKQRARELKAEIKRFRQTPGMQGERARLTFKGNSIKYI